MMLPKHVPTYLFIYKILPTSLNYISFHFPLPSGVCLLHAIFSNCFLEQLQILQMLLSLSLSPSLSSTFCLHSSSRLTFISSNYDAKILTQLFTPPGSKQRMVRLQMLSAPLSPNVAKKQYRNRKSLAGNQRGVLSLSLMSSSLLLVLPSSLSLSSLWMNGWMIFSRVHTTL